MVEAEHVDELTSWLEERHSRHYELGQNGSATDAAVAAAYGCVLRQVARMLRVPPTPDVARSDMLTVGALREALAELPDISIVAVETSHRLEGAAVAYAQASDVLPEPVGTNPETDGTVGVLLIVTHGGVRAWREDS